MREPKCVCGDLHEVNAHRNDGTPIAMWTCPVHANVFEERQTDITLTPFQEEVLATISREHEAGRSPSALDIAKIVNRTVGNVERAMAVLASLNFIESA